MSRREPEVLIVGGGIAGLALAGYLERQGRRPTVIERAPAWRESGYGIGLWEDGLAVLGDLGVLETALDRGTDPGAVAVRAAGGRRLARATLPPDRRLLIAIHRADLHAALRECVPDDLIRMGTTPERIEERPGGVTVALDDGTTETVDVVVGADGVHSTVRESCLPGGRRRSLDTYVWSLWAPGDVADDLGAEMVSVWGPGTEGFVARIDDRVVVNLAARIDGARTVPESPATATLRERAAAVGGDLPALVEAGLRGDGGDGDHGGDDGGGVGDDEGDGTDPFFDRVREVVCERWHADRVVLVGDAAHAVHPISGMGASLALQDARALAQELATCRPGAVAPALARFQRRRQADARRVRRAARVEAALAFLASGPLRRLRNAAIEHTPLFDLFLRRAAAD